ncbi:MAG TPA: hypothetical protein VJ804_06130, partial [Acidimicrobiales bacterium]|nr:hypothetical protein [Acidimicrobiales bacterium]
DWLKVMVAAGFQAATPAADPALVLTPAALERLPIVDEACSEEVRAAYEASGALAADPRTTAPFDAALAANTPGQRPGAAPVLMISGDADTLIPPSLVDLAVTRLCRSGQALERRTYPGADHLAIATASLADALLWAADRFAGTAVDDACA